MRFSSDFGYNMNRNHVVPLLTFVTHRQLTVLDKHLQCVESGVSFSCNPLCRSDLPVQGVVLCFSILLSPAFLRNQVPFPDISQHLIDFRLQTRRNAGRCLRVGLLFSDNLVGQPDGFVVVIRFRFCI